MFAAALALTACGGSDPVAEDAENATALPSVDNVAGGRDGAPSADGGPPQSSAAAPATGAPDTGAAAPIPAALQGRWGMTPGDCTSTRGDAKGLLIVAADGLRFYESRAVPAGNVQTSDDSISANFAFTGEGQSWQKVMTFTRTGDTLKRAEEEGTFTYKRCG